MNLYCFRRFLKKKKKKKKRPVLSDDMTNEHRKFV